MNFEKFSISSLRSASITHSLLELLKPNLKGGIEPKCHQFSFQLKNVYHTKIQGRYHFEYFHVVPSLYIFIVL